MFPRDAYRRSFERLLETAGEKVACQTTVELLALAHDRGCEVELATILDAVLDAGQAPDIAALRARFAPEAADRSMQHRSASRPDPTALPNSTVHLTPLAAYEALLGADPEELA